MDALFHLYLRPESDKLYFEAKLIRVNFFINMKLSVFKTSFKLKALQGKPDVYLLEQWSVSKFRVMPHTTLTYKW